MLWLKGKQSVEAGQTQVFSHPQSILCDSHPQTGALHRASSGAPGSFARCIMWLGMLYSGVQEKEDAQS